MNRKQKEIDEILKGSMGSASTEEMEAARDRVWERLMSNAQMTLEESRIDIASAATFGWRRIAVAGVVAAIAGVLWLGAFRKDAVYAVLQTTDSALYRGSGENRVAVRVGERIESSQILESIGSNDSVLALGDGSQVEMRQKSQLSLERADDGIRIRLDRGDVIVTAAKQRSRHLYVQTKDVTVSVVGTVFLVDAEGLGSRVAVIQGEVQVQNGTNTKKLRPGEQVATNPAMPLVPVAEAIVWSRHAPEHLALLQQAMAQLPQSTTPATSRLEFAAASIRPETSKEMSGKTAGIICHGTDGLERLNLFVWDDGKPLSIVPQGRCVGQRVSLRGLIAFANGVSQRYVSGGPAWSAVPLHIEAVSNDPSTVTRRQLVLMVQRMLADRFKVTFHHETQEAPGYALVVAKSGPKLKRGTDREESPIFVFGERGRVVLKAKSSLDKLALAIFGTGPYVINKTGLAGIYEYEIPLTSSPAGIRGQRSNLPLSDSATLMSDVLEGQLGLRLQPEKSVPVDMIVIDHADEPSPN